MAKSNRPKDTILDVVGSGLIPEIRSNIEEIIGSNPEVIINRDLGGGHNLSRGKNILETVHKLFLQLNSVDFGYLPLDTLRDIKIITEEARLIIKDMETFNFVPLQNPESQISRKIDALLASYFKWFSALHSVISYSISTGSSVGIIFEDWNRKMAEIDSACKKANDSQEKSKMLLEHASIATHTHHFKKEADKYLLGSRIWLGFAIALSLAIIYILYEGIGSYNKEMLNILSSPNSYDVSNKLIFSFALNRILIASFFITLCVWFWKIFRANRHNYIINIHRVNALNTFQALYDSTVDQNVRNAILLQATHCIFSPQASGYMHLEGDSTASPYLYEVLKGITGRG